LRQFSFVTFVAFVVPIPRFSHYLQDKKVTARQWILRQKADNGQQ